MAVIEVKNLKFIYPTQSAPAIDDISFSVEESEFIVVCGKSGCGKSTLLRHLKKNMMPYGVMEGEVLFEGTDLKTLDDRESASAIGFVQQNPDNQLVTDKVWHELAFGLESLGLDNQTIKRRVAEMASYFDIQTWFRQDVASLSGGQKQLLNLASIMAMQPRVLILDEPTSQLDPIAASEFLRTVYKINRDLGVTVIISEHRLEELIPMADRIMVMDKGRIVALDSPRNIGTFLEEGNHPMFYGLPGVMKIYAKAVKKGLEPNVIDGEELTPITTREGRLWLEKILGKPVRKAAEAAKDNAPKTEPEGETVIKAKDVFYRYSKDSGDVLRDLNFEMKKGELLCILGGNGSGKSTTLKAISSLIKPQRGKIEVKGRQAMLPQNPQALFTEITCEEELLEALHYTKISDKEKVDAVNDMLELMEISHLRKSHPYDLSGGEQQRLALGKILLLKPEILLLDEPTKGLDPFFKLTLAEILHKLNRDGVSILMVSHDIEFCAEFADRCAMFFDGGVISTGTPHEFFEGNSFYTTSSNRMARKWFPRAITWEEVAACLT
ncbi:MAG: ATP-binding cassette domain-containing protein [Clostridiales bacterium]|nr:ATP-binding cassette domain-containing protein [Clostridiales bacterium]